MYDNCSFLIHCIHYNLTLLGDWRLKDNVKTQLVSFKDAHSAADWYVVQLTKPSVQYSGNSKSTFQNNGQSCSTSDFYMFNLFSVVGEKILNRRGLNSIGTLWFVALYKDFGLSPSDYRLNQIHWLSYSEHFTLIAITANESVNCKNHIWTQFHYINKHTHVDIKRWAIV